MDNVDSDYIPAMLEREEIVSITWGTLLRFLMEHTQCFSNNSTRTAKLINIDNILSFNSIISFETSTR